MKTIKEWLNNLPEEIKQEAINETIKQNGKSRLKSKQPSLEDAILGMFTWEKSTRGNLYWGDVYVKVRDGVSFDVE